MPQANGTSPRVPTPLASSLITVLLFLAIVGIRPAAFYYDDFQSQYVPAFVDMARALREGSFPLLSPYSWFGGALAGEYQYGVFSAFLLPLVFLVGSLPLSPLAVAIVLAAVHLAILSAGVAVLMASRGAPRWLALLAGTAIPFGGFFFTWGVASWFPMATSFAWVPLSVWAAERASRDARPLGSVALAALLLYLVLSAGWPFSCLSVFVVSAFDVVTCSIRRRSLRPFLPVGAAWGIAVLLAAPAWLLLVEHVASGDRLRHSAVASQWAVPLDAFLGMILPSLPVQWQGFSTATLTQPASDTFVGIALPMLVVTGLVRGGLPAARRALPEMLLVVLLTGLSMTAAAGPFRWPFRWLPVQSLAIALLAARLAANDEGERLHPSPGALLSLGVGLASLGPGLLWLVGAAREAIWLGLGLGAILVAWGTARRSAPRVTPGAAALVASCTSLVALHLIQPNPHSLPSWIPPSQEARRTLLDPARRYLSLHVWQAVYSAAPGPGMLVPVGNQGMLDERRWLNGYSPITPRGQRGWLGLGWSGFVEPAAHTRLVETMEPGGLFEQLGVSGLVIPKYLGGTGEWFVLPPSLQRHWRITHEAGGFFLLERPVALPAARSVLSASIASDPAAPVTLPQTGGEVTVLLPPRATEPPPLERVAVQVLDDARLSARLRLPARSGWSGLLFSRPHFPGYRAWLGAKELEVSAAYDIAPFVLVPPGPGAELVLSYQPRVLLLGLAAAGAGLLGVVLMVVLAARAGRRVLRSMREEAA